MKKYIGKYKKEGLPGGPNEVETTTHGFIVTNEGQWKYPGQPTLIPSNEITMQGVDFPVLGIDDTGHSQMMMPGADYSFPGSMVYELPMAQKGKTVSQNWKDITGTSWSKAKELGLTSGLSTENIELQKKFLANPEYYKDLAQGRQDVATIEPISVEQIPQPIASSISREDIPIQDQYRNVRQQEPENIIGAYNITPYGVEASPYTISDPRLLQLPTMVTDFGNDTEGSFIGEGSWSRLGAVPLTSDTGEFAEEYFDPLTGEAIGEFIPTIKSRELTTPGPNAFQQNLSNCEQDQCSAGMQYNLVSHLEGGWDELKNKLGITGDAWTMNENIINSGGQRIYGLGADMDIDRNKDYSSKDVRSKLYKARKNYDLDKVYESAQVGDIVEMYYPGSGSQTEAIKTGKGNTYTTHVGHLTEKDGVKYVTHNVHGTWHTDKLETLLKRSGAKSKTNGTIVSGILRPDYNWRKTDNPAISISEKPTMAISSSGDRNYYVNNDPEKIAKWQSDGITPVAKQYVQGLEAVAPDIAADFGLSNDQLELVIRTSFGVFGNESGFGISDTYKKKERGRKVTRAYKDIAPDWMPEGDEQSEGLSQIKLENAFDDPKAKALLKKYGINDVEQLYDPMYSSIATMLLTAMNYKQFEQATGLKAEDIDPVTMQNIMALGHNKGMDKVINRDFVKEGEFKKFHQLRRKGHKYKEGKEPVLTDQSILDGLATYSNIHMNPGSYTNKQGDFAASLNVDIPRILEEREDRKVYQPQESPEAYGMGEVVLQYAHDLVRDKSYADDKASLLAKIEAAKIEAIKKAEKLYSGSKRKLKQALNKIERDSRNAINEIENVGEKTVRKVKSKFEEGGNVNAKIYLGKYTMGPNKNLGKAAFQNGGLKKYQIAGETDKQFDLRVNPHTTVAESTGTQTPVFESRKDIEAQGQSRFFNQIVQEADRVAAITGDEPNSEQARQTVITGKQPEFVVNRNDPKYLERAEAYRNKYGIEIDDPSVLKRLANPMAQLEYYNRYGRFPNRAQMDLDSTYGNPMDLAGAIYNPFSYVQSGIDAGNATSKGNYGEAALSALGVLPGYYGIQGVRALARQASPLIKNTGKFLSIQTPKQLPSFGNALNSNVPKNAVELVNTGFKKDPHYHFQRFLDKKEEIGKALRTDEGMKRIQGYIDRNPHLQNKTVDDIISDFEKTTFVTKTGHYRSIGKDGKVIYRPHFENQVDNLIKEGKLDPSYAYNPDPTKTKTGWISDQSDDIIDTFNVDPDNAYNWYKYGYNNPSSVSMGQNYTPYDAMHILEHEFAHLFQRGDMIAGVDDVLGSITLKNDAQLTSKTFKDWVNKYNPFIKQHEDVGYSVSGDVYGTGVNRLNRAEGVKNQMDYWLDGSGGQEKAAFAAEVRENLLQRGILKNRYDEITPVMLEKHFKLYNNTKENKYNLRLYDMMTDDKNNFKFLSKALNRMPAVLPFVGAGAAAAAGSEPKMKDLGSVKFQEYANFWDGGNVNGKRYLGKYTMVKKAQNGLATRQDSKKTQQETDYKMPGISDIFDGIPENTLIQVDPKTGDELTYISKNYASSNTPGPMDYNTLLHRQAFQESSFRDDVITGKKQSPAGAMGIAQFMPKTIKDMKRLKFIDDSFDPYDTKQASVAQRQYMDWLAVRPYLAKGDNFVQQAKVLAAYNRGPEAIKDVLTKAKKDGYDIYGSMDWINHPEMPKETREYIEHILLKESPKYEKDYESVSSKYRDLYFKQDGGESLYPDYELFRQQSAGAPYAYEAPQVNGVLLPDPNRPIMQGTNATEYKVEWDGITMPSVVNGNYIGPNGAYDRYLLTGEHYPELADPASYSNFYDMVGELGLMQYGKGGLKQWFAEDWVDIKTGKPCGRGNDEKGRPYPACRPSKRINETTPKTSNEMSNEEKKKFRQVKRSSKRISYNHKRNNK